MSALASEQGGLSRADFRMLASNGFGDGDNSYAHSMSFFRGQVYVGTTRAIFGLLKLFPPPDGAQMRPWPIRVPETVEQLDLRAQIWRYDPVQASWTRVHTSPFIVGRQGREVPRDIGYRGMTVFQGHSDPAPALYVSALSSTSRGTGARILRSLDGDAFEAVSEPGLGNPNVSTFRSLVTFDGYLVAAPAGEGKTWNTTKAPIILRSADPVRERWDLACEPGFGDENNGGIFELHASGDFLYAGTFNHVEGYQVWRTAATGGAPWRWEKCIGHGAYRGATNEMAMSFCSFKGSVYVGSGIQNGGYDRWRFIGPAAAELIRLNSDGSWDLVVGTPRDTPDGRKVPLSGYSPGFDDVFAGYLWRMVEHQGWLYASMFDWSQCLPFATKVRGPYEKLLDHFGSAEIARTGGGFSLWRSRDGAEWVCVTPNGFENAYNYGARTLLSTPYGLFLGTANPFGPEIAVKGAEGWQYQRNPRGGNEIWVGLPEARRAGPSVPGGPPPGGCGEPAIAQGLTALLQSRPRRPGGLRRVLVTGATGLVGRRLMAQLRAPGDCIRALVLAGEEEFLEPWEAEEVVVGDLTSPSTLEAAVEGIDTVYHLAAVLPGATQRDLMRVNVHGTENLLLACVRAGKPKRFVFTSSVAVYSGTTRPRTWPIAETGEVGVRRPGGLHDYGLSKIAAERLVERYGVAHGWEFVILRASMVYGNALGTQPALDRIICENVQGLPREPTEGAGDLITTQMIYVEDLAAAIAAAGRHSQAANVVFNLAGWEAVANRDLARLVRRLAGLASRADCEPDLTRIWRRYLRIYDTSRAEECFGFLPGTCLHDGLEPLVAQALAQSGMGQPHPRSAQAAALQARCA